MRRPGILVTLCSVALALTASGNVASQAQSEMVVQRDGTTVYHRPSCEQVRDVRDVLAMTRAQAESRGLKPHAECDPAQNPAAKEGTASPAKPAMVLVDVGGQYYHREKCEKLSKDSRRVSLTEAYKKHWPCRTCKPPIRPRPGK
jgi:methylphosphotriester-DNA--protein-cysteine methyltransferase